MAAQNKTELLAVTNKDFAKLEKLLASVPPEKAETKLEDDSSIKDIIGHRGHWITLFLGWYADGVAGKEVFFPAKGYKWNQLKAYNAQLRADQSQLTWADVQALLRANHAQLLELINGLSEAALYGGPMKGANNNWTAGRWAEAAGPSHYRSAQKYIRQMLRAMA